MRRTTLSGSAYPTNLSIVAMGGLDPTVRQQVSKRTRSKFGPTGIERRRSGESHLLDDERERLCDLLEVRQRNLAIGLEGHAPGEPHDVPFGSVPPARQPARRTGWSRPSRRSRRPAARRASSGSTGCNSRTEATEWLVAAKSTELLREA